MLKQMAGDMYDQCSAWISTAETYDLKAVQRKPIVARWHIIISGRDAAAAETAAAGRDAGWKRRRRRAASAGRGVKVRTMTSFSTSKHLQDVTQ